MTVPTYLQVTWSFKTMSAQGTGVWSSITVSLHVHPQIIASARQFVTMWTGKQLPLVALFVDTKYLLILQPAK